MRAADKTPTPTPTPTASATAAGAEPAVLGELDAGERGFLLATMLAAPDAADVTARTATLAGPSAERCQRAAAAIGALARPLRLRLLGQLAAEALAPVPAGLDEVDEELLQELLARESAPVIGLLASCAPALSPLRRAAEKALGMSEAVWREGPLSLAAAPPAMVADLQRAVLAGVVAVPPLDPGHPPSRRLGRRLATATRFELLQELADAGADLLGASLQGAGDETLEQAVAAIPQLSPPLSARIRQAARGGARDGEISEPGRSSTTGSAVALSAPAARLHARALVAATTPAPDPGHTLQRLGARAVGDRLAREDGDSVAAVAQRLAGDLRRELIAAATNAALADASALRPTCGRG